MSDLSTKFADFEEMINSNHLGITDALATILAALGGSTSETFSDLVTAITATNTLLTAQNYILSTKLDYIFNTLDTMNNNNALNAQRMYNLLLQTACPCDDTAPLLPPILDTTPTELVTTEKCQRVQYFVDLWISWVVQVGAYYFDHSSISSFQLNNLLALTLESIGLESNAIGYLSTSSRDSIATVINSYGSGATVEHDTFDIVTNPTFVSDLVTALYGADDASAATAAALTVISSNESMPSGILATMFTSNWANAIYAALPVVDASAYDGNLCDPSDPNIMTISATECASAESIESINSNGVHIQAIEFSNGETLSPSALSGQPDLTYDHAIFGVTNLNGYWVSSVPNCTMYCNANGSPNFVVTSTPVQIPVSTYYYAFVNSVSTTFIVTLCPTEP